VVLDSCSQAGIWPSFALLLPYWCPSAARLKDSFEDEIEYDADVPLEPVGENLKRQSEEGKCIEMRNLKKTFGYLIAVDGLSLSIYSGQITALLGHNGAGKTTTINMLTGALAPTSGTAMIAGKNVQTQLDEIREDIGICLQRDCLFPLLTVREHIQFFSRVKGLYQKNTHTNAEALVDQAIQDVALMEKRNTQSSNLSGGMKRKLCVAVSFFYWTRAPFSS
jgi:ATP-binding cassette subfamily A (ABC1) protein 3